MSDEKELPQGWDWEELAPGHHVLRDEKRIIRDARLTSERAAEISSVADVRKQRKKDAEDGYRLHAALIPDNTPQDVREAWEWNLRMATQQIAKGKITAAIYKMISTVFSDLAKARESAPAPAPERSYVFLGPELVAEYGRDQSRIDDAVDKGDLTAANST